MTKLNNDLYKIRNVSLASKITQKPFTSTLICAILKQDQTSTMNNGQNRSVNGTDSLATIVSDKFGYFFGPDVPVLNIKLVSNILRIS